MLRSKDEKVEDALKFIEEQLEIYSEDEIATVNSFGKDSILTQWLVRKVNPKIRTLWIKPPFLPDATIDFARKVTRMWNLNLIVVTSDKEKDREFMENVVYKPKLWKTNPELCYSDDTEILTENGWKLFKDLEKDEKVATLNPETEEIEYQKPSRYIEYHYNGKMFHQQGNSIDLLVTPDHNLWVGPNYIGGYLINKEVREWTFIKAENCPRFIRYKRNANWIGQEKDFFTLPSTENPTRKSEDVKIKMDDWLRFFGIWLAEGCICYSDNGNYGVYISQKDKDKKEIIKRWINKLPFNFTEYNDGFKCCDKQLYEYLKQFGESKSKFIPRELLTLSKRQLKILFDSLMLGDGNADGWRFAVSSKRLANDFQELLLKIGLAGTVGYQISGVAKTEMYPVYISYKELEPSPNYANDKRTYEEYNGTVYSVEVPKHHIIYVRRNGKACWCGNCCQLFKVEPIMKAVNELGLKAWFSGMRKTESEKRSIYTRIWKQGNFTKLHPILNFTEADVWRITAANHLPVHPWYAKGYRSLGCEPCSFPNVWNSERGGRWFNTLMEGGDCGIHCTPPAAYSKNLKR